MAVDITEKHLELRLAAAPKLRRVGFLINSLGATADVLKRRMQRSVDHYGIRAYYSAAERPEDIEPAMSRLTKQGA